MPGTTINRLCGSGLDAIGFAARAIKAGDADLLIAGGVESMSRAPFVMGKASAPYQRQAELFDIKEFRLTLVRRAGFSHHERRTRHRFHAAGNQQIGIAGFDRPGGKADGIQTRSAQAVNRGARHDLAAIPLRELLSRNPGLDPAAIDDVIFGCANQAGEDNRNVAPSARTLASAPP